MIRVGWFGWVMIVSLVLLLILIAIKSAEFNDRCRAMGGYPANINSVNTCLKSTATIPYEELMK